MAIDNTFSAQAYVVALTGGVASGKSTVAECFAARGVPVIDADVAAREVLAPGSDGLQAVVDAFGPQVLSPHGELDRRGLRQRVFGDEQARRRLEAIVHPRVRASLRAQVQASRAPWVLLVVPLLAENRADYQWVDRVLVVDVTEATQMQRLMQRDAIDEKLARNMLAAQATRGERLRIADDVLDNEAPLAALEPRVRALADRYQARGEA